MWVKGIIAGHQEGDSYASLTVRLYTSRAGGEEVNCDLHNMIVCSRGITSCVVQACINQDPPGWMVISVPPTYTLNSVFFN